jgi:hypothetical protein
VAVAARAARLSDVIARSTSFPFSAITIGVCCDLKLLLGR